VSGLTEVQLGVVCALRRCGWSATEERLLDELGVESWAEYSDEPDPIPWSIVDRDADGVLYLTESPSEPCCAYCEGEEEEREGEALLDAIQTLVENPPEDEEDEAC
jgi:hypothetical protein